MSVKLILGKMFSFKRLCPLFLCLFILLVACQSWALTLKVGENATITEMNYHDSWFENDPNNPEPWPDQREAYSRGNTAYVSLTATPEHAGEAEAFIGINFDWDLGPYSWDQVRDWPVNVTFNFSYNISAHWVEGNGSGNAGIDIRGFIDPWYDWIGFESGEVGTRGNTISEMYHAKLDKLGDKIILQVGCQAHSCCYPDENGDLVCANSDSMAKVTVQSIKIEFDKNYSPYSRTNKGPTRDSEATESEPVNIVNGNMYIIRTDLSTPSPGMPFAFTRAYNSIEEADGPLGAGWAHNFNIDMVPPADDNSPAVINDADGRVITFIQPNPGQFQPVAGEHSTLAENGSGYLWEKKDKTRYQFNAEGALQTITDRNGNTISLTHDGSGRLTAITDTAGRVYSLIYDGSGHITSISDPTGRTVAYHYDTNGNLIQVTDPAGTVTTYEYNDPNDPYNITKQTIGGSFIYTYSYDDQDRCIQAQGPNGENGEAFEYHPEDSYTVITDARGQTRTKYYNGYGEVTRIVYPDSSEETFTWDEDLNRTSATKQDGATWQYEYDGRGNLTKVTDPSGHQRTMTYDSNDNLTFLTDERGNTTTYTYDTKGNLTQITSADGRTTSFTYNSRGELLTLTDPKGKVTTYAYDTQGNLVTITDPLGNTIVYQYDSLGRRISMTDAKGNTTTYQYDALNRITKTTDALGGNVTTTHTQAGLAGLTDPNTNLTSFQYDVLNQLTGTTNPLRDTKTLAYDPNGNLATRTDYKGSSTTYDYDNLDRLTVIHYPDSSQVSFTYDAAGRMISMTDSLGTSTYTYDALGRLTSYTNPYGQSVSYSYDEAGNLSTITYPGNKVVTYTYDTSNRLTMVTDWANRQTTYSYNQGGDLIQITLPNGTKTQYVYDDAGRMIGLQNLTSGGQTIASYSYTLDKNGNIISEDANQPLDPTISPKSVAYTYGADNRLLHAGDDDLTYDKNGNLITKGTTTYGYDYENRLTQVSTSQGTWEYGYDGMGNRLLLRQNGDEHRFLIDPRGMTRVLAEYDGSNTLNAYYIYGLGLLYKVDASGNAYYYHYTFTGNIVAMTDQNQNIVNKYAYTPYGVMAGEDETVPNPFRYVGRFGVMDDGSGLLYMRARYYDPDLGRFITKDPIGFGGGVNLYAYVGGNPVDGIDPSGALKFSIGEFRRSIVSHIPDIIVDRMQRGAKLLILKVARSMISKGKGYSFVSHRAIRACFAIGATEQSLVSLISGPLLVLEAGLDLLYEEIKTEIAIKNALAQLQAAQAEQIYQQAQLMQILRERNEKKSKIGGQDGK